MTLLKKNVTTLTELKTVVSHGDKAAVLYDVSTGAAYGLDLEVLINMDASINTLLSEDVSINGVKEFIESPVVPNPTTATQADNKGSRDAADNDLRLELFSETIGNVHPQAQDKPTPPTNRRYRFTVSGDCIFEGVTFENTGTEMEAPFPVLKDDELLVNVFDDQYFYKYFQNTTKEVVARTSADNALQQQIDSLDTAMGNISSALDEILLIGGSI